jgi:hypothetical protein
MQTSNLETINRLFESGELRELVKSGVISPRVMLQREICNYVATHTDGKYNVAIKFGVSRQTVYNAIDALCK